MKSAKIFELIKKSMSNDLRFGQVVSNVFDMAAKDGYNPFFVEDDKFLEYLEKYSSEE